ncbi:hypothetical protein MKW92_007862 [Papaver armeniacum]|nr:hypothetical protein MKW92_007862 [Papaver armeniacum]
MLIPSRTSKCAQLSYGLLMTFQRYANFVGWSTKGYLACPCCHKDTSSVRLRNGRKNVYLGHRRFLPIGHRLRSNLSSFNGNKEHDTAPKPLTGEDVLRKFRGYHQITFGKEEHAVCGEKRRRDDNELPYNWKKISIFFELPYWKDLLLRHNIDVMHTEKNNNGELDRDTVEHRGYLYTLKKYVRNKSQPEGSIAQGYLVDECLTFCSRYLSAEINTKFNQIWRNSDGDGATTSSHELPIFEEAGRSLGKPIFRTLSDNEWEEARMYVLSNCDEILPFIEKHKQTIRGQYGGKIRENEVEHWHAKMFGSWFENHVSEMMRDGEIVKKDIEILSYGPKKSVSCYKGYIVNWFRFHTTDHEKIRKTQNSGVCVDVETSDKGSIKSIDYYVVLFNCHWWDITESRKKQRDAFGFTSLNFTRTIATNQPFMLAKQAHQVFYLPDNKDKNRRIVLKMQARDHYSLGAPEVELIQEDSSHTDNITSADNEIGQDFGSWTRNEIGGEEVIRSSTDGDKGE